MKRDSIQTLAEEFIETSPFNHLGPHTNDAEDVYGLRVFDAPLMAIGRADDPYWQKLWEPQVVGAQFMLPTEWVRGAKSVISFFLPATQKIKDETAKDRLRVPKEWLCARTDAQWVLMSLVDLVCDTLHAEGYQAIVPSDDPRFTFRGSMRESTFGGRLANFQQYGQGEAEYEDYIAQPSYERAQSIVFPPYNSNWSERHVAFVCGLGTFGLSTNLITEKGSSGRFMSVVTDWESDRYDVRPYTDYMEYCNRCGKCTTCCPGGAITPEGKNKKTCHTFFQGFIYSYDYVPRYGCGKCQTNMPCDGKIPGR